MDITVIDNEFVAFSIIDDYKSLIWTERYNQCGDFELSIAMRDGLFDIFQIGFYLSIPNSNKIMIIEKVVVESDIESGANMTISGRSLESILDRRIVWGTIVLDGYINTQIAKLIDACFTNPEIEDRRISNMIFKTSSDFSVSAVKIRTQLTGDNVYETMCEICEKTGLGFKVTLNDRNQFIMEMYSGQDRSYDQTILPFVKFSSEFDNLKNSNFVVNLEDYRNAAFIGGEGEGSARVFIGITSGYTGLERRELYVDARDLSSDTGETTETGESIPMSMEEYIDILADRGATRLSEHSIQTGFDGEADTNSMFQYGVDFNLGDIVEITDDYKNTMKVRVSELIISHDSNGFQTYPTFSAVDYTDDYYIQEEE